jgi:hypothetical protein
VPLGGRPEPFDEVAGAVQHRVALATVVPH